MQTHFSPSKLAFNSVSDSYFVAHVHQHFPWIFVPVGMEMPNMINMIKNMPKP